MQEAMRLRDGEHTVEELTDHIDDMKDQIRAWKIEFDAQSPNQLRATVADDGLGTKEVVRRREIARNWEYLERRIQIVEFAVREWDFLTPEPSV